MAWPGAGDHLLGESYSAKQEQRRGHTGPGGIWGLHNLASQVLVGRLEVDSAEIRQVCREPQHVQEAAARVP